MAKFVRQSVPSDLKQYGNIKVEDERVDGLETQLAEKVSKDEARLKSIKIDQNDVTEEFLQQMAGNTPINTIPQNGSVTHSKLSSEIFRQGEGIWYVESVGGEINGKDITPVFSIDSADLNLTQGDIVTVEYTVRSNDTNIDQLGLYLAHEDSETDRLNEVIEGFYSTDGGSSPAYVDFVNGQTTFQGAMTITKTPKQYLHILCCVEPINKIPTTNFYIYNVKITKGSTTITSDVLHYFYAPNLPSPSKTNIYRFDDDVMTYSGVKDDFISNLITNKKFASKKVVTLGDSITEGNNYDNTGGKWQNELISFFDCIIVNCGSSGGDIARMWEIVRGVNDRQQYPSTDQWYIPSIDYANTTAITIMIGINQGAYPTGSLTDFTLSEGQTYLDYPNTYYGYYGKCLEHIWMQNPNIRVYLMTPTYADRTYVSQLADDVRTIARYYGCPLIDNYWESGLNAKNTTEFMPDKLHPNIAGNKVLGTFIASQMINK